MRNLKVTVLVWFRNLFPKPLKDRIKKVFMSRLKRDLDQFKKKGTRFTPPLTDFPGMVMIDTTTRCNLHCAHCPNSALAEEEGFVGDMDIELYHKIIDEVAEEAPGARVRLFDGGEPLMRTDLSELVAYARGKGLSHLSINTNGTLLNAKRRKGLIKGGLNHVEISIDAATSETYYKIRRSPLFETVVKNTLAYMEESKAYDSRNQVSVSFVLQKDNLHELEDFKRFWNEKVDFVCIREFHQHNRLIDDHGRFREFESDSRHPCPYLWDRIIIYHNGMARFCESDWQAEHAIGDTRRQSIKEIWHGAKYRELRRQHIAGDFEYPYCKECSDWHEVKWTGL